MPNRWGIAIAGIVMQIGLGAVYAWSVFRIPLSKAFGWTIPQVTLTFTLAIFMLGFAAFGGGLWMRKAGPRAVALAAGVLYGCGVFLASFSGGHLGWLYFSYGVLGGIGLGLGYIVPVATVVKWFPDKRGMITGIAVAGFGAGARRPRRGGAGLVGPTLIAGIRQSTGHYSEALTKIAVIMLVSSLIPLIVRPPASGSKAENRGTTESKPRRQAA